MAPGVFSDAVKMVKMGLRLLVVLVEKKKLKSKHQVMPIFRFLFQIRIIDELYSVAAFVVWAHGCADRFAI